MEIANQQNASSLDKAIPFQTIEQARSLHEGLKEERT